jgi:hypothetical protein
MTLIVLASFMFLPPADPAPLPPFPICKQAGGCDYCVCYWIGGLEHRIIAGNGNIP